MLPHLCRDRCHPAPSSGAIDGYQGHSLRTLVLSDGSCREVDAMIKTILVPIGGGASDLAVLETARTIATPLGAHLEFLHVHLGAAAMAVHSSHLSYAIGAGVRRTLRMLDDASASRAAAAERKVAEFCAQAGIRMADAPCGTEAVTARWCSEEGDAQRRLLFHARHNDLIIMARATGFDGLPEDRLERLLLDCGRPLLIVPGGRPLSSLVTAMVCWKESATACRAVAAALPLLRIARRVTLVSVSKDNQSAAGALARLASQLLWHGVAAASEVVPLERRRTDAVLMAKARTLGADLLVMGGYGHGRTRAVLLGGCTQTVLEGAELPVLLMH
jgi:nucleotide-binding universal stress UspA family protein